ncbi:response regulator transcription factor [Luteimonas sp. BDR2-5]|uniref:response regulator transcription factor n=1 Tax=Proluteimonas luteida TaxID=2878685 RepID=UPI001E483B8D|nr:response regulator transcription factor [Luteimonas sp. BDR2-5]MCD9027447.1 response regulator transcription factor [Luteimonas sp. BDR2-5]
MAGQGQQQLQHRIAVVEDDEELREGILVPLLRDAGFHVVGLPSALALYRTMIGDRFDAVMLDVGLPDERGTAIARHLRELLPELAIVMLSGYGSAMDRQRGLEAGADAYLVKPVEPTMLVNTIHAVLRSRLAVPTPTAGSSGWSLDESGWRIHAPDGVPVQLTLAEQQIMKLLAATPGVAVSREALIARLVGNVHDFDPHRLEMLVFRLRRKCLRETGTALPLQTVRGVGYVLAW